MIIQIGTNERVDSSFEQIICQRDMPVADRSLLELRQLLQHPQHQVRRHAVRLGGLWSLPAELVLIATSHSGKLGARPFRGGYGYVSDFRIASGGLPA